MSETPTSPEEAINSESIVETDTSVSYLGVKLEKAKNTDSPFVPQREKYADFVNDKDLALPLQRDIAVSFLTGDPMLIEGGTSLGKTTTVRKMAAELGWEVHYANLNNATDVEDLMGRYIPNPDKNKPEDPEYIFADGKVTSGLRKEEGKVKVIILDEINGASPGILLRLHEVIDCLNRGENVVLTEDAAETVPVDKARTKIISLMNPPGKGYFGREPLDPAQLRRWVYDKLPDELPKETFSYAIDAMLGFESKSQEVSPEAFLKPNDSAIPFEELREIPGLATIKEKFKEFHQAAKDLLKGRKIAEDQPQPFRYDDRVEPHRVWNFVSRFFNGDINTTIQQGLRYYYANKLETETDRKKLDELIKMVEYKAPPGESKRRGLERNQPVAAGGRAAENAPAESGERREDEAWRKSEKARRALLDNTRVPENIRKSLMTPDEAMVRNVLSAERGENERLEAKAEALEVQYEKQFNLLSKVGILETLPSGGMGFLGINGKECLIPTLEQIQGVIEADNGFIEKKQRQGFTKLVLVPFGMKLDDLTDTYAELLDDHKSIGALYYPNKEPNNKNEIPERADLSPNEPIYVSKEFKDADINGKLVYGPKQFSRNHGGKTKQDIVALEGGWRVLLLEDKPNIQKSDEGKEKIGGRYQMAVGIAPERYLSVLNETRPGEPWFGEEGLTPEDWLMYAITHLEETNQVIDDRKGNGSATYLTGAYFQNYRNMPTAYFDRVGRQAGLDWSDTYKRKEDYGMRTAVRIYDTHNDSNADDSDYEDPDYVEEPFPV